MRRWSESLRRWIEVDTVSLGEGLREFALTEGGEGLAGASKKRARGRPRGLDKRHNLKAVAVPAAIRLRMLHGPLSSNRDVHTWVGALFNLSRDAVEDHEQAFAAGGRWRRRPTLAQPTPKNPPGLSARKRRVWMAEVRRLHEHAIAQHDLTWAQQIRGRSVNAAMLLRVVNELRAALGRDAVTLADFAAD